ncbi:MAG: hypothetical protein ACKOET_09050, partial [Verrucomicrobiota bacterium]
NLVRQSPVVDGLWKAGHEAMTNICRNDASPVGHILNGIDGAVGAIKKLYAESWNSALLELGSLDEFRPGIGVVNQAHPMARRAASMTSSCVRPNSVPDEIS